MRVCKHRQWNSRPVIQTEYSAFFQAEHEGSRQGCIVTCLTAKPLSCHVLWRPSFQYPIPSVFLVGSQWKVLAKDQKVRRRETCEGLSSLLLQMGFWQ